MAKYLFATGSVVSYKDKGIATSFFGQVLKSQGTVVTSINWAFVRMFIPMLVAIRSKIITCVDYDMSANCPVRKNPK